MRHAQTYPVDAKSMTQRKMVWCKDCGELLDDFSWKVPSATIIFPFSGQSTGKDLHKQ